MLKNTTTVCHYFLFMFYF